jgi:putative hydrolase of the HAD superfamily
LSDGRTSTQWTKIDALGLRDRLNAILITSELGPGFGKPSPRAFDCVSTRLQVVGSRSVYVADNPAKDFLAPNAIGWTTVQVRRADALYRDQTPPPGGGPKHVIESLQQLARLLHG